MNLQLFAQPKLNVNTSIVDYLKSQGQDSSYTARTQIAKNLGIKNYQGTDTQNIQMLNTLKNGAGSKTNNAVADVPKKADKDTGKNAGKNTPSPTTSNISGVDSAVADKMNSQFTASGAVSDAQGLADTARNNLTSMSAPSVSQATMNAMNAPFQVSSAYQDAMNYTNAMLEKISSGRTSYTDQIKDMMNKIQNREKFSYDVENDTLFQQALASAMGSGKQAMQDTIGQASALTGGYGSTYATSAGNQAYNAYIEDAYNNLPEYYQMAMDAYNMEGQEMYNQLSMLSDADAQEYQRMYDSWSANFSTAQNMYNQEYGAWQDSVNNAYNSANLQLKEQGMAYDQAYTNYNALQSNAENLYSQEYKKWQDEVNNAINIAGVQNSDYWSGMTFNENVRQHDETLAENRRQYNSDNAYRYDALAQDQSQFVSRYDLNGDGRVDARDNAVESSSNGSSNSGKYTALTNRELESATNTYKQLRQEGYSEVDAINKVDEQLKGYGKENVDFAELDRKLDEVEAELALPWNQNWEITKDTYNGGFLGLPIFRGVDHNDKYTNGNETLTYDQLEEMLEDSDLDEKEKEEFLKNLSKQSKK